MPPGRTSLLLPGIRVNSFAVLLYFLVYILL